ncbi:unnamed protein product [Rangifer tarandus platyrhynchus]|uniref:Uncharacterized protein n=1 Tax=Rangifer tarandus platyrhynchus TaxID=3082113 RepID=A0ABN8XNK9_RANTA|nr:unnamed protein product [Rangifer tarandus platyrhynchus]
MYARSPRGKGDKVTGGQDEIVQHPSFRELLHTRYVLQAVMPCACLRETEEMSRASKAALTPDYAVGIQPT